MDKPVHARPAAGLTVITPVPETRVAFSDPSTLAVPPQHGNKANVKNTRRAMFAFSASSLRAPGSVQSHLMRQAGNDSRRLPDPRSRTSTDCE